MSDYGIYVIQLKAGTRELDHPPLPAVYVGQSWHEPQERFRQHQEGDMRGSRKIAGKCRFLCPELYADIPRVAGQAHSVELEDGRAMRLRQAGFTVICNGEWREQKWPRDQLRPFDLAELRTVEDVVRDHALQLEAAAGRRLRPDELQRVLTWSRGDPTITDLLPAPDPRASRYRHVDRDALQDALNLWFG